MKPTLFTTQQAVADLKEEVRLHEEHLASLKQDLEKAIEGHRKMIEKCFRSKDPETKRMARAVATYWEVPLPKFHHDR